MVTINDVCNYLLQICYECGDYLTNLKLQKLVYYAQAWHLALYKEPLFSNDCQAWVHGPVFTSVYHRFNQYGWNPIQYEHIKVNLAPNIKSHLDEIFRVFNRFTASELEQMTHQEEPWQKARIGLPPDEPSNNYISKDDMKDFYSRLASQG